MTKDIQALQEEQTEYWNGMGGENWVKNIDLVDRLLNPLTTILMEHADLSPGERIIDIGCGTGCTSLQLAEEDTHVLGIDISEPIIAEARRRASLQKIDNIDYFVADAATYDFSAFEADLAFSRFGVMFFADPIRAFANIHVGLKSDGRLNFMCWQPMVESSFFVLPLEAAASILPKSDPIDPRLPGPFAFGDKDYVHTVLSEAGFSSISIDAAGADLPFPENQNAESISEFLCRLGPIARLLLDQDELVYQQVKTAVANALNARLVNDRITVNGKVWIVQAEA